MNLDVCELRCYFAEEKMDVVWMSVCSLTDCMFDVTKVVCVEYIDGLVEDCCISIASTVETQPSCLKSLMFHILLYMVMIYKTQ